MNKESLMKLFKDLVFIRTPGCYLATTTFIYFVIGMFDIWIYRFTNIEIIQITWIFVLGAPLAIPSLGKHIGIRKK